MGTDCRVPWLLCQPVRLAGSYTSPVFPLRQLLVEQTFKKRLLSCLIEGLGGFGRGGCFSALLAQQRLV